MKRSFIKFSLQVLENQFSNTRQPLWTSRPAWMNQNVWTLWPWWARSEKSRISLKWGLHFFISSSLNQIGGRFGKDEKKSYDGRIRKPMNECRVVSFLSIFFFWAGHRFQISSRFSDNIFGHILTFWHFDILAFWHSGILTFWHFQKLFLLL